MRIIAKSTLRLFWESRPEYIDAKTAMTEWYNYSLKAEWTTPHKIKENLKNASILKNNRVVFNICGNKYRIVTRVDYQFQMMLIRFVGTHAEYDKINNIEEI